MNKIDLTYKQHICEWDIPLSESSCFSYDHTLKITKNCFFLKYSNAIFLTMIHVLDKKALLFEKVNEKVYYVSYGHCIIVRRNYQQ